jgi:hypothetical protein
MIRISFVPGLACALALALAHPVMADEFSDSVADAQVTDAAPCCDDPNDALGAPDAVGDALENFSGFVTLKGDEGDFIQLDFDDNLCFESGDTSDDLIVYEYLGDETYTVAVGLQGSLLSGPVAASGDGGESVDLSGVASGVFNTVKVVSTSNGGTSPGADIDAAECLFNLDQADIVKTHTGLTDIEVGVDLEQTGYSFTIDIMNNTGIDGALNDLVFVDSVPGEFDLDPVAEDAADGTPDDGCADGTCDGIDTTLAGNCSVTASTSNGAEKQGRSKLEPEIITIDPINLDDGASCTVEVFAKTDAKTFPKGRSPAFAPTSCPEDPGVIVLNDGVRVFDDAMTLLLHDDDMLTLDCLNFTD